MNPSSAPPAHAIALATLRQQIDQRLAELLPTPHDTRDRVAAAMRDGVLAPGKRTRPLLMLLAGRGLGFEAKSLLDVACAVEMVHAASLFLDDMPCMDNAWLRRGRPTTHARFGQDVAVLGAVALLSRAWGVIASTEGLADALRVQLAVVLCEAVGHEGLVRGQYRDLHEGASRRTEGDIASANEQKTGVLFSAALDMAARAAGADTTARDLLRAAAGEMGQAFQMRDDLEDGDESDAAITKDRHKDDGKSTLVTLLGRAEVQRRMRCHLAKTAAHLQAAFPRHPDVAGLMLQALGVLPASQAKEPDSHDPMDAGSRRSDRAKSLPARQPGHGASLGF